MPACKVDHYVDLIFWPWIRLVFDALIVVAERVSGPEVDFGLARKNKRSKSNRNACVQITCAPCPAHIHSKYPLLRPNAHLFIPVPNVVHVAVFPAQ